MTNETLYINYLKRNGFKYDVKINAYTKPVRDRAMTVGYIYVRIFMGTYITPMFKSNDSALCLPTIERIADLLDLYDRQLGNIELGR